MIADFSLTTPEEAAADLGRKLRQHRVANDISQSELAKRVDVSPSTIKRIESLGRGSFRDLMAIAIVLGIERDILEAIPPPPLRSLDDLDAEGRRRDRARSRVTRRRRT